MHVDLAGWRPPDSLDTLAPAGPAGPPGRPFARVLDESAGTFLAPLSAPVTRRTPSAGPPGPGWGAALARLADGQRAVDGLIAAAARGRTFTPAQLLALQAAVSRGAQTIEVVSRAADRLVGTMKQALGTQL